MTKSSVDAGCGGKGRALPPTDSSGQILKRHYRLDRLIRRSSLGELYQAYDLFTRRACLVKLPVEDECPGLRAHQRMAHEADVLSRLSHPNIIEAYEFNRTELGIPFLVTERLAGGTLQDLLTERGTLSLARVLELVRPVGEALQYAHDLGIVHGDIRPSNIFVSREPDGMGPRKEAVKILEFGLARLLTGDRPTATEDAGLIVGAPAYLAPEALTSDSTVKTGLVDARLDQWSLAVVIYQLLTGRLPFFHSNPYVLGAMIREQEPTPLEQLMPELPAHALHAIKTALSRQKELRYTKVIDFIAALAPPEPRKRRRGATALTLKAVHTDLVTRCRSESPMPEPPPEPVPVPVSFEEPTRRYPPSFSEQHLLSCGEEALPRPMSPPRPWLRRIPWIRGSLALLLGLTAGAKVVPRIASHQLSSLSSAQPLPQPVSALALRSEAPAPALTEELFSAPPERIEVPRPSPQSACKSSGTGIEVSAKTPIHIGVSAKRYAEKSETRVQRKPSGLAATAVRPTAAPPPPPTLPAEPPIARIQLID